MKIHIDNEHKVRTAIAEALKIANYQVSLRWRKEDGALVTIETLYGSAPDLRSGGLTAAEIVDLADAGIAPTHDRVWGFIGKKDQGPHEDMAAQIERAQKLLRRARIQSGLDPATGRAASPGPGDGFSLVGLAVAGEVLLDPGNAPSAAEIDRAEADRNRRFGR